MSETIPPWGKAQATVKEAKMAQRMVDIFMFTEGGSEREGGITLKV
jgi:hypothetical protein